MLDACSSGDVVALERQLIKHGIQSGSQPIITQCVDGKWSWVESKLITGCMIPPTEELLDRAVATKQLVVVKFILQTYPSFNLSQGQGIARTVIRHPDPTILKALCDHDGNFASLSMDYGFRTFFTQACEQPPTQIVPVLHVLLDYGADVDDGWGPGGGALYTAIIGGQPVEIIDKVLALHSSQHVPVSERQVIAAMWRGDQDIVAALFSSARVETRTDVAERYITQAEKTGDKAIITLTRGWVDNMAKKDGGLGKIWSKKTWSEIFHLKF